jgi:hypothetical protein
MLTLGSKGNELRVIEFEESKVTQPPDIEVNEKDPVRQGVGNHRFVRAVNVIANKLESQTE